MNLLKQTSIVLFSIASLTLSCKNQPEKESRDEKIHVDSNNVTATYPSEPEKDSTNNSTTNSATTSTNVSLKTFQENSEWGYDILIDDKLYIHQPHIPSVPGNNGFKTEADAKKTGEFIEYKIKHHIMPPSVTPEELDSLGVWKKQM